jgi:hypothetical protein
LIWRGSSNQRILRLSDRYSAEDVKQALMNQKRALSFSAGSRNDIAISGAQSVNAARRLMALTRPTKVNLSKATKELPHNE